MLFLYAVTLFCSAMLLFWVQPMVAKMLLPLLGGTPTVWNTCMVFFQAMLLAGYGYAHFLSTRFSLRVQTSIHLTLLLGAATVLPIGLSSVVARSAPWGSDPFLWLLRALFLVVALPFFVISASGPLLQSWFSRTPHRAAKDPYFLYASSNLGSLLGLLGYPVLLEPTLRLREQSWFWAGGYGLLIVLFAGCAWFVCRRSGIPSADPQPALQSAIMVTPVTSATGIGWARRGRWIFWAFIPSSLMLGVTTYLTTDIASVPLLWVIPLGIYLVTFILVFARKRIVRLMWLLRLLPMAAVALIFLMLTELKNPAWLLILVHLVFFFLTAMVFHTRLADDRPPSQQLTVFYFCLSLGGVLGGLFNALLAPLVFQTVVEYPLVIVLACLAAPDTLRSPLLGLWRHPLQSESRRLWQPVHLGLLPAEMKVIQMSWRGLVPPCGIGLLTVALALLVPDNWEPRLRVLAVFGLPMLLCYFLSRRPLRFGLALALVLLASQCYTAVHGRTLRTERDFFGALRITEDPAGRFHRLYHGTTMHGLQFIAPERQGEPLAYYDRTGPCGQLMTTFNARPDARHIGVIGLGAGGMAAYAQAGQQWTFYEIDPAVLQLAQDSRYFTYLRRCTNASLQYKIGDARLRLHEAVDREYDLLVCDAFGSDVPPLHLLNHEAMELYLAKLAPAGLLLFHVSSRYFDFGPVLGNLAAHFGLHTLAQYEGEVSPEAANDGKCASFWVVLARNRDHFGTLQHNRRWQAVPPKPGMRLWTDDYSNILGIFQWR